METNLIDTCPFCGHQPQDLRDALHPTGTGWREDDGTRYYIPHGDTRGFHGRVWEMGCLTHEGGCGASITGDSRNEVIAAWNRRPSTIEADATDEPTAHGHTIAGWIRNDVFIKAGSGDDVTTLLDTGFEPVIKVPPSATFNLPTEELNEK